MRGHIRKPGDGRAETLAAGLLTDGDVAEYFGVPEEELRVHGG